MSDSASKELALVKELMQEGKMEEALQLIKDIEENDNLPIEDKLKILGHKAFIYSYLGQFEIALKTTEELYQKSQETEMLFFSLDALFLKAWVLTYLGKFEELYNTFEQQETMFNSLPQEDSLEYQEREVNFLILKANVSYYKTNFDLALRDFEKSLTLLEKSDLQSLYISNIYSSMAFTYNAKGEVQLASEFYEKALSHISKRDHYFPKISKADIYRGMGLTFSSKGDLNNGLEYHKRALEIYKKFEISWRIGWSYYAIINLLVMKKQINQAQKYLQQFKNDTEKPGSNVQVLLYQLSKAIILRSSSKIGDHVEAEKILKKIVKEESIVHLWVRFFALSDLCRSYFERYQLTNRMEILDDIQPLIDQMQGETTMKSSYFGLATLKLFQAKLALLQINMVDARKLLTEAQKIAEEHGLQILASEISREHDRLLEELKLWESIKKTKASVSERLKLASVDEVLERMQGRRKIEPPELTNEEPISLLIMDNSGATYFNHIFVENWDFSDLFSAFMSAFNTFSGEIFSKSIDRIKIGENTILINPIEPFLACYIIKGQSYSAQQKLTRFSDTLKTTTEIWDALNRAAKTSEMLELNNPPSLGTTVNEIFIK